ncbi:MAG: hypothetical protein GX601_09890 [Anaerolineales bacterium]|nr:hypothetical protein [Anaerolineales bacterium]
MKGQWGLSVVLVVGVLLSLGSVTAVPPISAASAETPPPTDVSTDDIPVAAGTSSDWWATVQEALDALEYYVTWQEQTYLPDLQTAYQAPNRAHNLRTYFGAAGPIVIPRKWLEETNSPPWRLELTLTAWGRAGALEAVAPAMLEATENRIEYRRGEVVEWYQNEEDGLRQGFALASRPAGEGLVQLDLVLGGNLSPQLAESGSTVEFRGQDGVPVLRLSGSWAVDAEGHHSPVQFSLDGATLSLVVDDADAVYPVSVVPVLASLPPDSDWQFYFAWANTMFGRSVATAGDVNADGYSDVIIGLPFYDGGQTDEGRVFVFYGSAAGLEISAAWQKEADQAGATFGWSVATAGDVDGDGDTEVIVGAPDWDDGETDEGGAWVYYGSPGGLNTGPGEYYQGSQDGAALGVSVAAAGDVNGDGYGDVIVGASLRSNSLTEEEEGFALVYFGSEAGLSNGFNWRAEGEQEGASLGRSVATAGDVNGDGFADVIVGADRYDDGTEDEGKAFVWYGSEDGLNGGVTGTPANADWSAQPNDFAARFGTSVSTAGDVNGDGCADVIVGGPYYGSDGGVARLYLGSSTGLDTAYANQDTGGQAGAEFGYSVATAGDVNGDGYADVIVGSPMWTNGENDEGRALVWLGSANGIHPTRDWVVEGDSVGAWYGFSVATAGDVNGDGYSDIIVGAPHRDTESGATFAYYGGPDSLEETASWTKVSNLEDALFGWSVSSAGDVDADGYADVVVGAPYWDGGQADEGQAWVYMGSGAGLESAPDWHKQSNQAGAYFGYSVGRAGDVNGDGWDDVIVGAPGYENVAGEASEGMAWVYPGSDAGLESAPLWYKDSDQAGAQFGYSVATAGDVNGDGYGDVIVGVPGYTSPEAGEGGAWVYEGSADGPHVVPDWHFTSNQAGAQLGAAVGTAGDINADGYSDVIVGAPMWDHGQTNEGGAWVFLGSRDGLEADYTWRQDSDHGNANYGASVGTAGDVNGDGRADIIVGAPLWNGGLDTEGAAFVYHSSGDSLYLTSAWSKRSNQAAAHFGCSVGTAGDVNGDGYADIIVGASRWDGAEPNEGGAWVYHGSTTGVHSAPDWHTVGGQAYAQFGTSVAGAGDVNGDGYADVVISAPRYDAAFSQEGQVSLFYGNGGKGSPLGLAQLTSGGSHVAHLGMLDTDHFWLEMWLRSPFGRGGVAYEIEAKPLGVLFDGSDTWIPGGSGYFAPMPGTGTVMLSPELQVGTVYHWRLRRLYDPATTPWMPASHWMTIPWNGWNEADLRTDAARVSLPVVMFDYD